MLGQCDHFGHRLVNATTRESGKNQVWAPTLAYLMVYAPIGGTSRCPAVCTVQSEDEPSAL